MTYKNGISYIVTVYNKEKFILQTLESIKYQFDKNSELIIINDGSSDNSERKIKEFIQSNSKMNIKYNYQNNSGPSSAVNKALKFIKYSHIKLVDGDDILSNDAASYMKGEMERLNLDLLYANWDWHDEPSKYSFNKKRVSAQFFEFAFEKILNSGWGGSSNLMVKSEVIVNVGGCDPDVFIQDYSLPLRISGHHLKKNTSPYKVGLSKEIICVGPKFIKNRIMSNEGQTLYDLSLATINFLKTHSYISDSLKIKAKKKIIGRCLKWNRRKHKKNNLISNIFRRLFSKQTHKSIQSIEHLIQNTWYGCNNVRKIKEICTSKKKILIYVGLDLLGDALIKVPFLLRLRAIYPKAEITWLAGKGKSEFNSSLKMLTKGLLDKIIDNYNFGSSIFELFKQTKINENYDIVIDTQKRLLTTLILRKIKTQTFISPCSNFLFSDLKPKSIEKNLSKQLLQLSFLLYELNVKTSEELSHKEFKSFTKKFQLNSKHKKAAICPGASVVWKCWPLENFINLAEYLYKKKIQPVFFLGPKEFRHYDFLKKKLPFASFPLQENNIKKVSPMHTLAFAKCCSFGISNDTGCGHLLSIANIPLISLFGPTDEEKFAPFNYKENIVLTSKNFSQDSKIENIPINAVINSVNSLLKKI